MLLVSQCKRSFVRANLVIWGARCEGLSVVCLSAPFSLALLSQVYFTHLKLSRKIVYQLSLLLLLLRLRTKLFAFWLYVVKQYVPRLSFQLVWKQLSFLNHQVWNSNFKTGNGHLLSANTRKNVDFYIKIFNHKLDNFTVFYFLSLYIMNT